MSDPTTAEGTRVLGLRARLPVPPATAFHALTDPPSLRAWLADEADVDLDAGRFCFWGRGVPQGERGRHRLVTAEPNHLLAFTWPLDGVETEVRIELAPAGAGWLAGLAELRRMHELGADWAPVTTDLPEERE